MPSQVSVAASVTGCGAGLPCALSRLGRFLAELEGWRYDGRKGEARES